MIAEHLLSPSDTSLRRSDLANNGRGKTGLVLLSSWKLRRVLDGFSSWDVLSASNYKSPLAASSE